MKKRMLPVMLLVVLILSGVWSLLSILSIQGNARVINYAGVVRGASQLLIKQELHGDPNDALMNRLDQIIDELMTGEGNNHLAKLSDPDFQSAMKNLKESWFEIKKEILNVRLGDGEETLYHLSENLFKKADLAVSKAEEYTEEQVNNTIKIFCALFVMIAVGTSLFVANGVQSFWI